MDYIDDFGFIFTFYNKLNPINFSKDYIIQKVNNVIYDKSELSRISDIKDEEEFDWAKNDLIFEYDEMITDDRFIISYILYLESTKDISDYFFLRPYYKFSRNALYGLNDNSFIKKIYNNKYILSYHGNSTFIDDMFEMRETYLLDELEKELFISDLKTLNYEIFIPKDKFNIAIIREI